MNKRVADWYSIHELRPNLFSVREPADAAFYVLKDHDRALLIDSGLGLLNLGQELLSQLGIRKFSVLNTHAHCDHIGLNVLAESVTISQVEWSGVEWEKFLHLGDSRQIEKYHTSAKDSVQWPEDLRGTPKQLSWTPKRFVQNREEISFGKWKLRAIFTPGHTSGHMVYWDQYEQLLFLGDLLYDGTLYAHMPDSSLSDYRNSLDEIKIIADSNNDFLWLSCHNTIPLDENYFGKVRKVFSDIANHRLTPVAHGNSDDVFVEAEVFEVNGVRVAVRSDDLDPSCV